MQVGIGRYVMKRTLEGVDSILASMQCHQKRDPGKILEGIWRTGNQYQVMKCHRRIQSKWYHSAIQAKKPVKIDESPQNCRSTSLFMSSSFDHLHLSKNITNNDKIHSPSTRSEVNVWKWVFSAGCKSKGYSLKPRCRSLQYWTFYVSKLDRIDHG